MPITAALEAEHFYLTRSPSFRRRGSGLGYEENLAPDVAGVECAVVFDARKATPSPVDVQPKLGCPSDVRCNWELVVESNVARAGHGEEPTCHLVR